MTLAGSDYWFPPSAATSQSGVRRCTRSRNCAAEEHVVERALRAVEHPGTFARETQCMEVALEVESPFASEVDTVVDELAGVTS